MQININYTFKNPTLLKQALTHPSALKGLSNDSYEKLEFLGDSVISLVISESLYRNFPKASEGDLSIMHAKLVGTYVISEVARNINLGKYLIMDIGEDNNNGRDNSNNLENAMEAVIGAIYLDSDFDTVQEVVMNLWKNYLTQGMLLAEKDVKSRLQEVVQKLYKNIPIYTIIGKTGADHSPRFKVSVQVQGYQSVVGEGKSKKEAEVAAATNMLNIIEKNFHD